LREFGPGELIDDAVLRAAFQFIGPGVRVFRGCRVFPAEKVSVGAYSQIDEGVVIFAGSGVVIGSFVHLATLCSVTGGGACEIGDFAGVSSGCRIVTGTDDPLGGGLTNPTVPAELRRVRRGSVRIGAHAVLFTNAVVLPDVVVGDGAVVSAGCVVHKSLKPWTVYAGNPLVPVGRRDPGPVLEAAAEARRLKGVE
jgi:galactoside O-acetyltransferase